MTDETQSKNRAAATVPVESRESGSAKLLLINDIASYGKVALAAMVPVLSHMGYECFSLPTVLVSNTLDYGRFHMQETTDFIQSTLAVWKEMGFAFDAVATGFLGSQEQAELVASYCQEQAQRGVSVFVDPIMGDEGKLYNGVTPERIQTMRTMVAVADCIVPNYTEAAYLTGRPFSWGGMTAAEAAETVDALRALGTKSVVVTSAVVDGADCIIGYDHVAGEYFTLPFEYVDAHFPGTGDIFSAVLYGWLLRGLTLAEAAAKASSAVHDMVALNRGNVDKYKGIPLETCMEVIDR